MLSSDRLLYVISARQKMPWAAFRQAFDGLHEQEADETADAGAVRRRTARALDLLGHADFFFDESGSGVYAAPPVLAALPTTGLPEAVLCGTRAPSTLDHLRGVCADRPVELDADPHPHAAALTPVRIGVRAESEETVQAIADDLGIPYLRTPPARTLLAFAGDLGGYLDQLDAPRLGTLASWKRKDFDPRRLQFRWADGARDDFRLSQCLNPNRGNRWEHFFFDEGRRVGVDRNWGRYEVLRRTQSRVLHYDHRQFVLAVPGSAPLPRLLARTLALCSGYAPRFAAVESLSTSGAETWGYHLYSRVPKDLAVAVAAKVSQTLLSDHLDPID
jgi:hypothetical protein